MAKEKILIGILVIVVIIISTWWILNNIFVEKPLQMCGPSGKYFWVDISNCNKSCQTDEDCKFTCGCGAINKNEICHDKGIIYNCVDRDVKCENNICVVDEEKVIIDENFEQCIEAPSFTEYFNKAGIMPYTSHDEQDWEKLEPVSIPVRVNFPEVKIYKIPIAIAGGDVLTTPVMKHGNKYCKFTDLNSSKLFTPIQKEEAIKYLDFQSITLAGSAYGAFRTTILNIEDYNEHLCETPDIVFAEKKITTVQETADGFLVDWIYYTSTIQRGYYENKIKVGYDGTIQTIELAYEPFINCGPGVVF